MRILIGMTRSDTMASGSFKHIVQIGQRFRAEGVEVAYAIGHNGPAAEYLKKCDFKVYEMPYLERDLKVFRDFISLLQLILIILQFRPNVCSWHTAKIGALGRIASLLTFRKNFYIPHGVPFFESEHNKGYMMYRRLEKVLGVLPATIVGVCEFDTEQYLKLGVPESKTMTIHNGMRAVGERKHLLAKGEKVIFITAARFEDQKDYPTLAAAVNRLAADHKDFELHIYGDGRKEAYVRSLFSEIPEQVKFMGVVEDLTTALLQAHVFVLSSHWEGLPRTIIEAMSCNMPVVATSVGGVKELINHGKTGYLVEPGDSDAVYRYMKEYLVAPELIIEHGGASYRKYKAEFTLDLMLEQYVKAYIPEIAEGRKIVAERVTDA